MTDSGCATFISDLLLTLRGSGSSLYGSHASAGVVNVITDQGGGVLRGEAGAEGGGLGMARGFLSMAWTSAQSGTKVRAHAGNGYRAPALYERFGTS